MTSTHLRSFLLLMSLASGSSCGGQGIAQTAGARSSAPSSPLLEGAEDRLHFADMATQLARLMKLGAP